MKYRYFLEKNEISLGIGNVYVTDQDLTKGHWWTGHDTEGLTHDMSDSDRKLLATKKKFKEISREDVFLMVL